MKSIIPRLAITILAAGVLAGCNQSSQSNSTDTQSTNLPVTSSTPYINTNTPTPAPNSVPEINTNLPASTNLVSAI